MTALWVVIGWGTYYRNSDYDEHNDNACDFVGAIYNQVIVSAYRNFFDGPRGRKFAIRSAFHTVSAGQRRPHSRRHPPPKCTVWVKKIPPVVFWNCFPNGWEFLINFLHTYYIILSTLDNKFLFKYLQLWQSYAILSAITQRNFTFH